MVRLGKTVRWFGGKRGSRETAKPQDVTVETVGPKLTMLVSDASGFASFKAHQFVDTASAANFVQTWYGERLEKDNGIIAFWTMTERPQAPAEAEAIVLVRETGTEDVVYPFSFVEMAEAHSFVRFEMSRDVDPTLIQVYWAVPVKLAITTDGSVRISPDTAPARDHNSVPVVAEAISVDADEVPAEADDVPSDATVVSSELIDWMAASSENDPIENVLHKAPAAPKDVQPRSGGGAVFGAETPSVVEKPAVNDDQGGQEVQTIPTQATIAAVPAVPSTKVVKKGAAKGLDLQEELQKVLRVRRWDERATPFTGFDSPPGRF
jgi:hypothetical protein